ncbi:vWA domain-containing protein [Paenibacillus sanfengchensis]|uniref:vWA domain-containing protein n=1 Tax=Paenibacillus TaxID=44249 RepID=UPI003A5C6431
MEMKQKFAPAGKLIFRTIILFLIFSLFVPIFVTFPQVSANDLQKNPGDAFDAVFVLDTSYSMNHADPNKTANEVIHMFMDMSEASRTRIGFVAYNHHIVASSPLTPISVTANRTKLKQAMAGLRRTGYTDLGLGLVKGGNLLSSGKSGAEKGEARIPFMILLSDGETDFGPVSPTNRTVADSTKDVETAIKKAQKEGYPIYTIGLNHDGTVNPDELERIANETGGASYITSSADDLPEIFNRIFAAQMRSVLMPVAGVTATGKLQEVPVDIPNSSMGEANIILLSEHPLQETQLFYNSENIRMFKSGTYTLVKIKEPGKGTAKVKFRGTTGDLVKISLLGSYALETEARLTGDSVIKGKPAGVEAYLTAAGPGKPLEDLEVYAGMTAKLVVLDKKTNEETSVDMRLQGGRYTADYTFPKSGDYAWSVKLNGPSFYRNSPIVPVKVANLAPAVTGKLERGLIKEDGVSVLPMKELFTDANGDSLVYEIKSPAGEGGSVSAELADGQLRISPLRTGQGTVTLVATDPEGGTATAVLKLSVKSKYTVVFWSIAGGLVLAAAGFLLYLWLRPKPAFTGKLEGYFLATASGSEVPVKSWPLTSFTGRSVSLGELFRSLDVNEPLPEAEQIMFKPAKGGKLFVKNTTRCSLVRNRTPLPKNKQEILEYNDKLYITFEDGITEIELRYKPIKPNTNIFIRTDASAGKTG